MSRLSAIRASKNARVCRGAAKTRVREISIWRMVRSHQNPAAWSAAVSGTGSRAIHRAKNTPMVPGCSRAQMACRPSGSLVAAKPLDSWVKAMPALIAWRLAHSCPLTHSLNFSRS